MSYKPCICGNCGRALGKVRWERDDEYTFDSETGRYDLTVPFDSKAKTLCSHCGWSVGIDFPLSYRSLQKFTLGLRPLRTFKHIDTLVRYAGNANEARELAVKEFQERNPSVDVTPLVADKTINTVEVIKTSEGNIDGPDVCL